MFVTPLNADCGDTQTPHAFSNWHGLHTDNNDIAVVIHREPHPIQLRPFQTVAIDDETLKRFMGKHFTIYIMAMDQWLQELSRLASREPSDSWMIHTPK